MSRTYRKSSMDHNSWWKFRAEESDRISNYYKKRHYDGRSRDKAKELTKEHATWERRKNDEKMIVDFNRGVDPDAIEYRDDRNLRGIIWNYD